jgi:serine/threonine protein kinase/Tol biopolymer transport system component
MHLPPGTRVGFYEITASIGAGGMGEVYRARDAKLRRDVAIKVLPQLLAADPDRVMRFEREAQALAALNHPNIAQVFGVIDLDGPSPGGTGHTTALVMELVEGEDLAERLRRGPIPVDDALAIAAQIADALEAAHERGIVHRDLKPANIKVRSDGAVKVLDFGLAKAIDHAGSGAASDAIAINTDNSPTLTSPVGARRDAPTEIGVILGTAAYMAPEQARGRAVDRRADIWAFGCVLYEMLTARAPFSGDDVTLTLAAILKESVDYSALPRETPPSVRRLLRRCLEKDPRHRLSSSGDARLELQEAVSESASPGRLDALEVRARPWRTAAIGMGAGAAIGTIALVALGWRPVQPSEARVVRSDLIFDMPLRLGGNRAFALSPSGTELIFSAYGNGDHYSLYRRRLDGEESSVIPGSEEADGPFFSPDGQWIGFLQNGRLKKMPTGGGPAVDLGEAAGSQGGAFAPDGSVVFNKQHGEGLLRIPAGGSERTPLTTVDRASGEAGHHWPHMLPGAKHLLFTLEVDGKPYSEARIMLLSLDTGERRLLIDGGSDAQFLAPASIVYWRNGTLWRVPFDPSRLEVTGPAVAVLRDVMLGEPNGQAHFSIADNGTIVYLQGRDVQEERGLMIVDRQGQARALGDHRAFETVSASPDGTRVAVTVIAANDSLWLTDFDRPSFTRITFESENSRAVWSPDGNRIALARHQGGEPRQVYVMPADGSASPERLRQSERAEVPDSWTANGNLLAFTRSEPSGLDVWVLEMTGTRAARPVLTSRFNEVHPRFSPDGQWLAYASDESGQFEVYVRPFPGPGSKRLVSIGGGTEPRWRGDGREIFYRVGDAVMSAEVAVAPIIRTSNPRMLFKGPFRTAVNWQTWDVLPDGQRFLLIQDFAKPRLSVTMVQNWVQSLH